MACTPEEVAVAKDHLSSMGEDAFNLTGGRWVTINGAHVYIKDGVVVAGAPRLLGNTQPHPKVDGDQLYEVCFAAGTLVVMKGGGKKAIETIEAGEWVMAVPDTDPMGELRPSRVIRVFHNEPARIWHVKVAGQVIRTTSNHPAANATQPSSSATP